jgi:hypothetical protein
MSRLQAMERGWRAGSTTTGQKNECCQLRQRWLFSPIYLVWVKQATLVSLVVRGRGDDASPQVFAE